jgi:hypothetical protein
MARNLFLINISSKEYNEATKEWDQKELFGLGSKVFLPKYKSKNAVNGLRTLIAESNPLIQDEQGTACWLDLELLVKETLMDERKQGHVQSAMEVERLPVWIHWGTDSAGWLRGISHSKIGFKFVGNRRVCNQSPANMRTILLFEGKDNHAKYKELMKPFFPVMDGLTVDGLDLNGTHYDFKQTMGADYVLLAEIL